MQVVGVDGWRRGWVGITLVDGRFADAWIARDAGEVIARAGDARVIGIDIPIGLPESGSRSCDQQAKRLLGRRASSVFLAPPRSVLEPGSYAEANALCKARFGFGISRQSYGLRSKILEVDSLSDPRLHEVHPELSFQMMLGEPFPSKKTWAGVASRQAALAEIGIEIGQDLGGAGVVPPDDVLDAAAAAWTAHRIAHGRARFIPEAPEFDARGKPMAIWF